MEKSLNNALDELLNGIDELEEVKSLDVISKEILKRCKTKKELKEMEFLVNEFNEKVSDVNEISSFISNIIKEETEI